MNFPGLPSLTTASRAAFFFLVACLLATLFAVPPILRAQDDEWFENDFSTGSLHGSSHEENGVVTLRGTGADIWGSADEFLFRYQSMTGNGSMVAHFTPEAGHPWAKVGLMIRENMSAYSPNVMAFVTPGNHIGLQARSSWGGETTSVDGGWVSGPIWLALDRQGYTYRAYRSYDGENWVPLGSYTFDLSDTVYAGLAVTSHDNTALYQATADNVFTLLGDGVPAAPTNLRVTGTTATAIRLAWDDNSFDENGFEIERATGEAGEFEPLTIVGINVSSYEDTGLAENIRYRYRVYAVGTSQPSAYSNEVSDTVAGGTGNWAGGDIGVVGSAGSTDVTDGGNTFTLHAGGGDIWDTADAFRMHYRQWQGNGTIIARVASLANTDPWAKAGVMIRGTFDSTSANAAMLLTAGNACGFQTRATAGAATEFTGGPWVSAPQWVKLIRVGDVFTGYVSADGVNWTLVGSRTVAMGSDVFVGVVASAHSSTGVQTTAVFNEITIE